MKQPRTSQRLSSLLLASLMLFTAVWGAGRVSRERALLTQRVAERGVSGHGTPAKQTKSGKTTDSPSDVQVSAAQYEAVVTPVVQLGESGQTAFLLPAPTLLILLLLSVPLLLHFTLPHYFFSYFRHVFGHAIAPNAP